MAPVAQVTEVGASLAQSVCSKLLLRFGHCLQDSVFLFCWRELSLLTCVLSSQQAAVIPLLIS